METWYILEDGSCGDPREISPDEDGKLRHRDGRAVAYAPHGPRSRGVDADAERSKGKPKKVAPDAYDESAKTETRDMKPGKPKRSYKTRESKAD